MIKQRFELTIETGSGIDPDLIRNGIMIHLLNLGYVLDVDVQETTKMCSGTIHYGPFLSDPKGRPICANCHLPVVVLVDTDRLNTASGQEDSDFVRVNYKDWINKQ